MQKKKNRNKKVTSQFLPDRQVKSQYRCSPTGKFSLMKKELEIEKKTNLKRRCDEKINFHFFAFSKKSEGIKKHVFPV